MSESTHSGGEQETPCGRAPRGLYVEEDTDAATEIDWSSWTLTDEDALPGSFEQWAVIQMFGQYLESLALERGWQSIVAGEVFFAWGPSEPNVRVSPDGFICDDRNLPRRGVVNTWEPGRLPPRFALEVVSKDRKKDYVNAPHRYAALGSRELAVFDPVAADGLVSLYRRPLSLFRRLADGSMRRVYEGGGPVFSEEIGAWLLVRRIDGAPYLRIARDEAGRDLVATAADAQKARADEEKARADREQALRAAAEHKLRELEDRLRAIESRG